MNSCLCLGDILAHIVAMRIARLHAVDPDAAQEQYDMQTSAMDADEAALFASVYVQYLIELGG